MFSHPVSVFGYLLVVGGVICALSGDYLLLVLGFSAEALGFFMILIGVVAQGFRRIERHLAGIPAMKAAFDAGEPKISSGSAIPSGTPTASRSKAASLAQEIEASRKKLNS